MVLDLKDNPKNLPKYREQFKNVYPFSDGIFKLLMANEAKPERTIKFLNAMLGLSDKNAIKSFTLGVQEQPGILDRKTSIFDIYGITEGKDPILIEVQQNANKLYVDRLTYYTSRVVCNQVKKSKDYDLPRIYVLSLLCEDQFPDEIDTYFHHCQIMRNRKFSFDKVNVFLVEMEKFFKIDDRTAPARREKSNRAEMLRLFRDVLEEKSVDEEKASKLLDSDFAKDVSFMGYTDELLLLEVDNMTDMLYEKQGSYLQGKADGKAEGELSAMKKMAKSLKENGVAISTISKSSGLTEEQINAL